MNTKPDCQAFACLAVTNQTAAMDIADVRRKNLAAWFSQRSIPAREKSYISQLMTGRASFGEKAARRLESTYGMPALYLDGNGQPPDSTKQGKNAVYPTAKNAEEAALLLSYRSKTRAEQRLILKALDIDTDADFAKSA